MRYKDKSYFEKRDILRDFYNNNYHIKKVIDDFKVENYKNIKYKILVDGYAAFKITKKNDIISELDPNNLGCTFSNGKSYWLNKSTQEKYDDDEILYFCFDYDGYHTSLVEYMMLNDLTDITLDLKNTINTTFKRIYREFNPYLRIKKLERICND